MLTLSPDTESAPPWLISTLAGRSGISAIERAATGVDGAAAAAADLAGTLEPGAGDDAADVVARTRVAFMTGASSGLELAAPLLLPLGGAMLVASGVSDCVVLAIGRSSVRWLSA
jgi:hypothetical protein